MFPKITNGRVDPQLTNVLLAFKNPSYLADQILPTVPNLKDYTGKVPEMGQSHLHQYASKRAVYDEGEHRITFTISNSKTYEIDDYDLSTYLPDRVQTQLQLPFNARNAAQFTVMEAMMLEREIGLADALSDTSVLTNQSTPANLYTDGVNSTPEVDFETARDSVHDATGLEANAILMSRKVANVLRRHPWFLEIGYRTLAGGSGKMQSLSMDAFTETLKSWFALDFVFIGKPIKITSREGQTVTKGNVWGNDVVFFVRPKAPSLFTPSMGYSFQISGKNKRTVIRRHQNDKGDLVEVQWAYQDKILQVEAAYLLKTVI
ncbi:MAG: hypothetical protein V3T43_06090 [Nitrosomonadaceae bacterium]